MDKHYIECQCDSAEHIMRIMRDDDPAWPQIYVEVQLNPWLPWYKRVWRAVRYVFGYQCKWGHWDVTTLDVAKAKGLQYLLSEFVMEHS